MFITRLLKSGGTITRYISEAVAFVIIMTLTYLLRNNTEGKANGIIPRFVFYAYYPLHLAGIWLIIQII